MKIVHKYLVLCTHDLQFIFYICQLFLTCCLVGQSALLTNKCDLWILQFSFQVEMHTIYIHTHTLFFSFLLKMWYFQYLISCAIYVQGSKFECMSRHSHPISICILQWGWMVQKVSQIKPQNDSKGSQKKKKSALLHLSA